MNDTTWIFCCGMRRSGSTLQYNITKQIIERVGGRSAGWVTWQQFDEIFKQHDGRHDYVALKCHAYMPDYSDNAKALFMDGKAKAVYIYRDLRDVAASLLKFSDWESIAHGKNGLPPEIVVLLNEYHKWMSVPGDQIHIARYEDVYDNIMYECYAVSKFLGIDRNMYDIGAIARDNSLAGTSEKIKKQENKFDSETLYWQHHIGAVVPGSYKEILSDKQISRIENLAGYWLEDKGYL